MRDDRPGERDGGVVERLEAGKQQLRLGVDGLRHVLSSLTDRFDRCRCPSATRAGRTPCGTASPRGTTRGRCIETRIQSAPVNNRKNTGPGAWSASLGGTRTRSPLKHRPLLSVPRFGGRTPAMPGISAPIARRRQPRRPQKSPARCPGRASGAAFDRARIIHHLRNVVNHKKREVGDGAVAAKPQPARNRQGTADRELIAGASPRSVGVRSVRGGGERGCARPGVSRPCGVQGLGECVRFGCGRGLVGPRRRLQFPTSPSG
jgi:hypothetical protein